MSQCQIDPAPWAPPAAVAMACAIGLGPETAARLLTDKRMETSGRPSPLSRPTNPPWRRSTIVLS
jgi:hypothetical protein